MAEILANLREPPVVGQFYMVPVVDYTSYGQKGAWPVLGPLHSDAELFNFPHNHYHIDGRFMNRRQLAAAERWGVWRGEGYAGTIQSTPLFRRDVPVPKGRPRLARRMCFRETPPYLFGGKDAVQQLRAEYSDPALPIRRRDGRLLCPHRKVDLSSFAPDADGLVTCPLHGLRVRCAEPQQVAA